MRQKLFYFLIVSFLGLTSSLQAGKEVVVPLSEIKPDGISVGWTDNSSWADVDVEFRADEVFEELKAQRIVVSEVRNGRAQLLGPTLTYRKDKIYTITVRMRSSAGDAPIWVMVREPGAPYEDYLVNKALTASPEWRSHSFYFESTKTVSDYPLYLAFPEVCDISIERIDVLEESKEEFDARVQEREGKNPVFLHPNPTFKLGTAGYSTYAFIDRKRQYPFRTGDNFSLEPPVFKVVSGEIGDDLYAHLELGRHKSVLASDLVDLLPGREVKILARVRRTGGAGLVTLRGFSPAWVDAPEKDYKIGEEWVDLEISGMPPRKDGIQVRAELVAGNLEADSGDLEIKYLAISQDLPTAREKLERFDVETFGLEPDRGMTLYEVGEIPTVRLKYTVSEPRPVEWRIVDAHGVVKKSGSWLVGSGASTEADETLEYDKLPVGWWQIQWTAPWAIASSGVLNIGIVPPIGRVAGESSPFGIHVEGSFYGLRKMEYMGLQWLRTNQPLWTKWTAVQPERNVWIYPDEYIERFTDAGKSIVFMLDRTPLWAARTPGVIGNHTDFLDFKADLPDDWPAWREYVRRMVARYKDTIDVWEVWNEPDIPFLRPPEGMTNAEAYLKLLENSSPIIRELDPESKIVASPAYTLTKRTNPNGYQEDFTERLIDAGGMKYLDVYSIHHYLKPGHRIFDNPDLYEGKLDLIRSAMKEAGVEEPEIWNTEWGIINFTEASHPVELPSTNGIGIAQAARELVVWNVGMLSAGLERLIWYDGQDNFYLHFHVTKNLFDYSQPKPAAIAYAVLTKELDGMGFQAEEGIGDVNGRVLRFAESDGGRVVRVAYAKNGGGFDIKANKGQTAVDFLGQPVLPKNGLFNVGEDPIYIRD